MTKVIALEDVSNVETVDDLKRFVTAFQKNIKEVVNGNITAPENIRSSILSVTFTAANTDVTTNHGLGKTPIGYIVLSVSAAMIIYTGSNEATSSQITLKSSATGVAKVMVI